MPGPAHQAGRFQLIEHAGDGLRGQMQPVAQLGGPDPGAAPGDDLQRVEPGRADALRGEHRLQFGQQPRAGPEDRQHRLRRQRGPRAARRAKVTRSVH